MLSENIREFRIERGMSQMELAKLVGVSQGAIYFWENGINEPTAGCVVKLAKAFNVSVDELLSYDGAFKKEVPEKEKRWSKGFSALNESQQDAVLGIVEELLKK